MRDVIAQLLKVASRHLLNLRFESDFIRVVDCNAIDEGSFKDVLVIHCRLDRRVRLPHGLGDLLDSTSGPYVGFRAQAPRIHM